MGFAQDSGCITPPSRHTDVAPIPVGIVGSGRTRNGLGPMLATFLERSECRVVAVAGRSTERAVANAATLEERLGHAVHPCRDLQELCTSGISALVIASPPEHHLAALQAAVAQRLPVLCEKPLVHELHASDGFTVVDTFIREGTLLMENCQWPFVLPVLQELYGTAPTRDARRISLALGPPVPGRVMVQNIISHVLSLAQAVACVDSQTRVSRVRLDHPSVFTTPNALRCHLEGPLIDLEVTLYLDIYPHPPRPAWFEIDGARIDRTIGPGYTFLFRGNGREVSIPDPVQQLVSCFSECLRIPDSRRIAVEGEVVRERLRLYRAILSSLPDK